MPSTFDLQGHRGARGLKPENTLPSFEVALGHGVTSIETDVHLTADGVPVIIHDPRVSPRLCRLRRRGAAPPPSRRPPVSGLTLAELRAYVADRNPDRRRFPAQDASPTPAAVRFAGERGFDPYAIPTLGDVLDFLEDDRAVRLDLELKRVPFRPEAVGDAFDGEDPGTLEERVVAAVRSAGRVGRVSVRSFDHRCVRAVKRLEPRLRTGVLVAGTAPVDPVALVKAAGADDYFPEHEYLDERQVRQCRAAGVRVVPWTVNDEGDARRLLAWGVDGLTTDYPDRLAALARGFAAG